MCEFGLQSCIILPCNSQDMLPLRKDRRDIFRRPFTLEVLVLLSFQRKSSLNAII